MCVVKVGTLTIVLVVSFAAVFAQRAKPPPPRHQPLRTHSVNQSDGDLDLVPADKSAPVANRVSILLEGEFRVIRSNGIPDHPTGKFPNRGNPNRIEEQHYEFKIPADPRLARNVKLLGMRDFGVAVNGIPFNPGAAEWYHGDHRHEWQYEALSGAIPLGLDASYAHVQPDGAYHYHGLPMLLLENLGFDPASHSPLVGWAGDGFPIYAVYGYTDGKDATAGIRALTPSYRLKTGARPESRGDPAGEYDGTFVEDYEYVEGLGDLDECNGRSTVTPEFPEGTYAYFLTVAWPVVPRCFRGQPSREFVRQAPPPPDR
ncbi:MAG: YHYH protein [Acidobacteriota bacterium]|nr:YHYH protein [Acidobacteriota bacterium]